MQAQKTEGVEKLASRIEKNKNDYDAHYDKAICELAGHKIEEAMEHFFFIQQHKPDYKEDAARKMIASVIDALLTSDPESAKSYRRQLSSLISG